MKRLLLAAAILLYTTTPTQAQRWTLPTSVQSQVDEVFTFVDRDAPGCALGVIQNGKLAYGRGYGLANLDWGIPITTSTVFDIGSVSKQYTAASVALLDVEGVLSIDDDVRKWVPELPEYERTITLRHLLNHTSGIRDYLTLMDLQGFEFDNVFDEFDGVELITRQQGLNFEPGSEYLYSNSGYLLLANIVRRATGQSLREFLEERFFDPMDMAHTMIWDENSEIVAERATGYGPTADGWGIDHAWNFQMGGDGQVITSVEEMVKWDALFYDPVVGGQGLMDRLHTRAILNDGDTISYALGISVDEYRGIPRVQHGGAWAGFRAHLTRFPEQKTSVALLCNRSNVGTSGLVAQVVEAVLAEHLGPDPDATGDSASGAEAAADTDPGAGPVELTRDQLSRWEGVYRHPDRPESLAVELRGSRLFVMAQGETLALDPYSDVEFEVMGVGMRIVFDGAGDERSVSQVGDEDVFEVVDAFTPTEVEMAESAGQYRSEELDVTWKIVFEDGELELLRPGSEPTGMLLSIRDELSAAGMGITLERAGGSVTGFRVFAGRVTDILFVRIGL